MANLLELMKAVCDAKRVEATARQASKVTAAALRAAQAAHDAEVTRETVAYRARRAAERALGDADTFLAMQEPPAGGRPTIVTLREVSEGVFIAAGYTTPEEAGVWDTPEDWDGRRAAEAGAKRYWGREFRPSSWKQVGNDAAGLPMWELLGF